MINSCLGRCYIAEPPPYSYKSIKNNFYIMYNYMVII